MEGYRAIGQIVHNAPHRITEILYAQGMQKLDRINCPYRFIALSQFSLMALSRHPAGPLAVVTLPPGWDSAELPMSIGNKILILEDIQDPGNIGSLVRSAAAFDFSGIILSSKCADPFAPKSIQASCGAIVSLWLRKTQHYRGLMQKLKEDGFRVLAADTGGKDWKPPYAASKKLAIAFGNEGNGLMKETMQQADEIVRIPFHDENVESLNVAASGAICMYLSTLPHGDTGAAIAF